MVDKISLSVAIIALIVAGSSLSFFATLNSSIGELRTEQSQAKASLEKDLAALRTDVTAGRERLVEAEKLIQQAKAEEALIATAQKEASAGPLILYGTMDLADMVKIVWPAFKGKYPWAGDVQYIEGFTPLMQRFQEEAARGVRTADVRLDSGVRAFNDLKKGLGAPLQTKYDNLYDSHQIVDGILHQSWGNIAVIIYNTNLLKEADAPKTWFDMADPKYKGSLVTADPRKDGTAQNMLADLVQTFGEEKVTQLIKSMWIDNKALIAPDWGSGVYNSVLAGEGALGTSLINDVVQQKEGAPVAVAKTDGYPMSRNYAYIYKNTPKPTLAKLFVEWFLSPEGQTVVSITGRTPALKTVESGEFKLLGTPTIFPTNTDNLIDPNIWLQKFKDIFKQLGLPE